MVGFQNLFGVLSLSCHIVRSNALLLKNFHHPLRSAYQGNKNAGLSSVCLLNNLVCNFVQKRIKSSPNVAGRVVSALQLAVAYINRNRAGLHLNRRKVPVLDCLVKRVLATYRFKQVCDIRSVSTLRCRRYTQNSCPGKVGNHLLVTSRRNVVTFVNHNQGKIFGSVLT